MAYVKLPQSDRIRYAKDAMREFWKVAHAEFPQNMQMSFEEFWGYMNQRSQETLGDFGQSVYDLSTGWGSDIDDAWSAMQEYARRSQGQVAQYSDGYPRMSDFFDALLGKMNEWPVSRIGAAFGNTAKETLDKVATVGGLALGGYATVMTIASAIGLFLVIKSYSKR